MYPAIESRKLDRRETLLLPSPSPRCIGKSKSTRNQSIQLYTKEWIEWVFNPAELASKKTTIYAGAYLLSLGKMENCHSFGTTFDADNSLHSLSKKMIVLTTKIDQGLELASTGQTKCMGRSDRSKY